MGFRKQCMYILLRTTLAETVYTRSHLLKCKDSTSETSKMVRGAPGTAGHSRGQVRWGCREGLRHRPGPPNPGGLGTDTWWALPQVLSASLTEWLSEGALRSRQSAAGHSGLTAPPGPGLSAPTPVGGLLHPSWACGGSAFSTPSCQLSNLGPHPAP